MNCGRRSRSRLDELGRKDADQLPFVESVETSSLSTFCPTIPRSISVTSERSLTASVAEIAYSG